MLGLSYSLQRMGDDGTCRVRTDPSVCGMATLKASLARVLFFLDPATPMRASTSALRSFRIPTQSTLLREGAMVRTPDGRHHHGSAKRSAERRSPLRQRHVVAGLQGDLDDGGALYVHLLADGGVASRHSACLVEAVRLHPARVVGDEHLQHDWFAHSLQLGGEKKHVCKKQNFNSQTETTPWNKDFVLSPKHSSPAVIVKCIQRYWETRMIVVTG